MVGNGDVLLASGSEIRKLPPLIETREKDETEDMTVLLVRRGPRDPPGAHGSEDFL